MDIKEKAAALSITALLYLMPAYAQPAPQVTIEKKVTFDDTLQFLERNKSTLHIEQNVNYLSEFWTKMKQLGSHIGGRFNEDDLLWQPGDGDAEAKKITKYTKDFFPAWLMIIDDAKAQTRNEDATIKTKAYETLNKMIDPRVEPLQLTVGGLEYSCTAAVGKFTDVGIDNGHIEYNRYPAVVCVTQTGGRIWRTIQPIESSLEGNGFVIGEAAVAQSTSAKISLNDAMYVDAIVDRRVLKINGELKKQGLTECIDIKRNPDSKYHPEEVTDFKRDGRWRSVRNWDAADLQEEFDILKHKSLRNYGMTSQFNTPTADH